MKKYSLPLAATRPHYYLWAYGRADTVHNLGQARGNDIYKELWINTNEHDDCRQHEKWYRFAQVGIGQPVPLLIERAVKDALEHPQQVGSCQDHRENAAGGAGCPALEDTGEGAILRG